MKKIVLVFAFLVAVLGGLTYLFFENLDDFKKYLKNNNVEYQDVKNKIEIESIWNDLIITKFSSKIQINENEIRWNYRIKK